MPLLASLSPIPKPPAKTLRRRQPMSAQQTARRWQLQGLIAGVDEAGRGPLAGPVMAAAVILDPQQPIPGLADSKQLSPLARQRLHDAICARALCFAIGQASVQEIDQLNILQATLLAMRRAVLGLRLAPQLVLVDGRQTPQLPMRCESVVKGDALFAAMAAASIMAKVRRDQWCQQAHQDYPLYGLAQHKGYGTPEHLAALRLHGPSPLHRTSFAPCRAVLAARDAAAVVPLAPARTVP